MTLLVWNDSTLGYNILASISRLSPLCIYIYTYMYYSVTLDPHKQTMGSKTTLQVHTRERAWKLRLIVYHIHANILTS